MNEEGATCVAPFQYGADERIRTAGLLITNELLYQLSYIGLPRAGAASYQRHVEMEHSAPEGLQRRSQRRGGGLGAQDAGAELQGRKAQRGKGGQVAFAPAALGADGEADLGGGGELRVSSHFAG